MHLTKPVAVELRCHVTALLVLNLSIHNNTVSTKIYDKQDDFNIVNFPFLDGDVPRCPSYGQTF